MHLRGRLDPQLPIASLKAPLLAHLTDNDWDTAIKELRMLADGCPACMLSAIRQSELQHVEYDPEGNLEGIQFPWNYREECVSFWAEVNNPDSERACHYEF
jgi:hypothetical protein